MHKKKIRRILAMVAAISLTIVTTGCGLSNDQTDSNGVAKVSSVSAAKMDDGIYVYKHKTGKFMPAYAADVSYGTDDDSQNAEDDATMEITTRQDFIWEAYADKNIPVLEKGDRLAYKSTESAPTQIALMPMNDYGYTIGTAVYLNANDSTWCISSQEDKSACENSSFANALQSAGLDTTNGQIRMSDIGGVKITEKMVTNVGTIKGLKLNKRYKVGIYVGTVYKTLLCSPDTHVFSYANADVVTTSDFEYTKNGYVFVNLPKNLQDGYYYISGMGLIQYKVGDNTSKQILQ